MKKILLAVTAALCFSACGDKESAKVIDKPQNNPLVEKWTTEFEVPPFEEIELADFMPAIKYAMEVNLAEIDAITACKDEPTFENTIIPYDRSGKLLGKISGVLGSITSANTTPEYQALSRELTPINSKHYSAISLNETLFNRIKSVYDNQDKLDHEQKLTVKKYYDSFARNGATLSAEKKEILKKMNGDLSMLYLKFRENTLGETNDFKLFIKDKKKLNGLPESFQMSAAGAAEADGHKGEWLFQANRVSMTPVLMYVKDRDIRKQIYYGYYQRGHNDNEWNNEGVIKDIVNLRVEKAQLLGYDDFASYKLDNNMAKTSENCVSFLTDLWEATMGVAKRERGDMQKLLSKEIPGEKLMPWDWWYYTEKVRKEKFDLDAEQIKPYFELEQVTQGAFDLATKLYGVTFKERKDLPILMDEVKAWEIFENNKHIGVLYMDFHPRGGKRAGAWCGRYRSSGYTETGEKIYPIINIVCNFTRPSGDVPALLTTDEVQTLFHEFGHGLHGLFSDGSYNAISGSMPRDMIELPSQIMENWSMEPEFLRTYAKHYKTGEVISEDLISKINKSSSFNQGFLTGEYLAAALLDMKYHDWKAVKEDVDIDQFEKETLAELGLIEEMLPRYRSGFFNHAFGGDGYSAGYYVYIWAAVLDADAYMYFKNSGDLYNKEIAAKFRKYILAGSGQGDAMKQYKKFRGEDPDAEALKIIRGLK